jgi:hypothetical protein
LPRDEGFLAIVDPEDLEILDWLARSTVKGKRGAKPQAAQRGGVEFAGSWESNGRIPVV